MSNSTVAAGESDSDKFGPRGLARGPLGAKFPFQSREVRLAGLNLAPLTFSDRLEGSRMEVPA